MLLPLARNKNIVVQNLDREILIYDLIIDKAFCLNETSSAVYQACDGKTSFEDLKRKNEFTDDIIFLALDQLKDNNLIDGEKLNYFAGLSRRDVIRKVGLATMIALPVISSLAAPSAITAASAGGLYAACTTSADCSSSAPNCVQGFANGSPKRCCIGTDSSGTLDSGQENNRCSGLPADCNSGSFTCSNPAARCCSGSGTVNCTSSGGNNTCICTCN